MGPALRSILSLFIAMLPTGWVAAQESACAPPGGEVARIVRIDTNLEPVLEDGRRLLIAGVETPHTPEASAIARNSLAGWLEGREIRVAPLSPGPDRWGRTVAHIHGPARDGAPMLAAFGLVDAGLVRVRPHAEAAGCIPALLKAEQGARSARLGVWSLPEFAVLKANDPSSLPAAGGAVVIAEGRVYSINATHNRTYINFGRARNIDLAVTIPRQTLRTFEGMDLKQLRGRMIRVRGLLERRPGPQIEVAAPYAIEILDGKGAATRSRRP
jgi:endonuclease YncB( thermonuclease family)